MMEGLPSVELEETAPTKATRVRYAVLISACLVALVTYVHRLGFAVGAPELKREIGLGDQQMGYLLAAFFWAYAGFQVLGGWLGDKFGSRHLLTFFVFAWSLVTGAVALVVYVPNRYHQFWFLLVLRFLFGVFQAGGFPLLSRISTDWMPLRLRGTSQGLIWMSSRLGGALIPLILVPMFGWFGNWRVPFWILASVGFVWCATFWPWFRDKPQDCRLVNDDELTLIAEGRTAVSKKTHRISWRRLLGSRSVWSLCLAYGCMGFTSNFFVGWLPTYLRDQRGFSADVTKWLTSLPLACGVFACLLGGSLSDWFIMRTGDRKWGRRLNGTIGLVISALAFSATIWVHDPVSLAILLCVSFAGSDIAMAPAWASCADIGESAAGTLSGAMNMMANVGGAVAAMVAGYFFQRQRPDLVFLIGAASYLCGSLSWLGVDVTAKLSALEPEPDWGSEA